MELVLDVYKRPYDPSRPVICMDETPKQLIRETRLPIKADSGRLEKYDYEYARCGVCSIFIANEVLKGKRYVKVSERRTKKDWAKYIRELSEKYPDAERIILVMDNLLS